MALLTNHPIVREREQKGEVETAISAREARRQCNIWLGKDVSMSFLAQMPDLFTEDDGKIVWRTPIAYTATHVGFVGLVGCVDVDVETGEIIVTDDQIKRFFVQGLTLSKTLPPYKPRNQRYREPNV